MYLPLLDIHHNHFIHFCKCQKSDFIEILEQPRSHCKRKLLLDVTHPIVQYIAQVNVGEWCAKRVLFSMMGIAMKIYQNIVTCINILEKDISTWDWGSNHSLCYIKKCICSLRNGIITCINKQVSVCVSSYER